MSKRPSVVMILEHAQFEALTQQAMSNVEHYFKIQDADQMRGWIKILERFQTTWKAYHEVQR